MTVLYTNPPLDSSHYCRGKLLGRGGFAAPYGLVGFDPVKGIPAKEKLEEYGMAEEAKKVWWQRSRSVKIKGSLLTHRKAGLKMDLPFLLSISISNYQNKLLTKLRICCK